MITVTQMLAQLAAVPTEKRDETEVDVVDANGKLLNCQLLGMSDGRFQIRVFANGRDDKSFSDEEYYEEDNER